MSSAEIRFTLDGREVVAQPGETLLAVADREGVAIPRLCHQDGYRPDGNCRACVVEIAGERALAPSCCRVPVAGHGGPRDQRARPPLAEDGRRVAARGRACGRRRPTPTVTTRSSRTGRASSALHRRASPRDRPRRPPTRRTRPSRVRLDACIQCGRCVRACREEQANDVIGMAVSRRARPASCSTPATRWATAPAWPAASACRRARPARSRPRGDAARRAPDAQRRFAVPVLRRGLPGPLSRARRGASRTPKAATGRRTTAGCA